MYCGARRASPPPWSIEERPPDACFIVRDHSGQALAYVYLQRKSRGRRRAAKAAHARRSAAHRRRHRQAAGAAEPAAILGGEPAQRSARVPVVASRISVSTSIVERAEPISTAPREKCTGRRTSPAAADALENSLQTLPAVLKLAYGDAQSNALHAPQQG